MKKIFLCFSLSLAIAQPQVLAQYPLSQQSRDQVALVASIGALVAGGVGYLIATIDNDCSLPRDRATKYALIVGCCAAIGALSTGTWSYYNTPEKTFEWAENVLVGLNNNELKRAVDSTQDLSQEDAVAAIKHVYWYHKYPSVSSVYGLSTLHSSYGKLVDYLAEVKDSHIVPVCQEAGVRLSALFDSQEALKRAIMLIKNNAGYAQELAAKDKDDYMCQMAAYQARIAQAQSAQAQAAWVNATRPQRPPVTVIHQAPPVVIVNH